MILRVCKHYAYLAGPRAYLRLHEPKPRHNVVVARRLPYKNYIDMNRPGAVSMLPADHKTAIHNGVNGS